MSQILSVCASGWKGKDERENQKWEEGEKNGRIKGDVRLSVCAEREEKPR